MFNRDGVKNSKYGAPVQILANVEHQYSVGCRVPQSLGTDIEGVGKIAKAGTPVYINLADRNGVPVAEAGTIEASASAIVSGTGVTGATVVASTFSTAVSAAAGTYVFEYDGTGSAWKLSGSDVTLATYGITVTGTATDGDKITVTFTPAGTVQANAVLLHNVDVTDGTKNGTALIWGFVNVNRLDTDVKQLVTAGVKVGDVQFLNA